MFEVFDRSTLVIIPCCAAKSPGGLPSSEAVDPLRELSSESAYRQAIQARLGVLGAIKQTSKYTSGKYGKNTAIADSADFGSESDGGLSLPALKRYQGSLYRAPGLKEAIYRALANADGPRFLILSALYGPLHPLSPIQDYNLMMSDAPAKPWSAAFPQFLADFAERNGIRRVALYVGTSTTYFKIARKATMPLLSSGRVGEAVQYHVVDGSTREAPTRHGALSAAQLAGSDASAFFASGMTVERAL